MVDKLCLDCVSYKQNEKKCWYYWDNKTACTQHRAHELDTPRYKELE